MKSIYNLGLNNSKVNEFIQTEKRLLNEVVFHWGFHEIYYGKPKVESNIDTYIWVKDCARRHANVDGAILSASYFTVQPSNMVIYNTTTTTGRTIFHAGNILFTIIACVLLIMVLYYIRVKGGSKKKNIKQQ